MKSLHNARPSLASGGNGFGGGRIPANGASAGSSASEVVVGIVASYGRRGMTSGPPPVEKAHFCSVIVTTRRFDDDASRRDHRSVVRGEM
jgi:hypothetical protein